MIPYIKTGLSSLALTTLIACGGGGGGSDGTPSTTTPAPSTGGGGSGGSTPVPSQTGASLSDTQDSRQLTVSVLGDSGSDAGTYQPSSATAEVAGRSFAVASGRINEAVDYLRVLDNGSIALVEPTDVPNSGSATYAGYATLRVTDIAENTVYNGTARAEVEVRLNSTAGSVEYTEFDGTKLTAGGTATSHTAGTLRVQGVRSLPSGISDGTRITTTGFGSADFDGATIDLTGRFAGPEADELGGFVNADGSGGTLQSVFATSK